VDADAPQLAAASEGLVYTLRNSQPALPPTFGDTVRRLDRELFVGREEEIAIFRQWVQMETRLPLLLYVSGPTGIGKSSLLRAFRRFAGGLGRPVRLVDGRTFPPTRAGFLHALGGSHQTEVLRHLNQVGSILLLDSFEEMHELSDYLRDEFLTGLEVGVKVAIAGRQPMSLNWAAGSHWHRLIRPLPLDGLSTAESRAYLRRCGLEDPRLVQEVVTATTGYPLVLALAASLLELTDVRPLARAPAWRLIVHSVAEHLLSEIEDARLRSLLVACAVIGPFDEATLTALAGPDDGAAAFAQLCSVSLVHPTKTGLTLQHNVRRVLVNDLKWRRPEAYKTLRRWARARAASPHDPVSVLDPQSPFAEGLSTSPSGHRLGSGLAKRDRLVALTPREREVVNVLGRGLTTSRQIGAELVISQGTANLHVKRVLHKLGFLSRAELTRWLATQTLPDSAAATAPPSPRDSSLRVSQKISLL
jgi:DNA-binding CsgD family transcriptional regulator